MNTAMSLTDEQREAIRQGQAVRLIDPTTQVECVVVRADVYERVRSLLVDDGPLTEEERRAAIQAAGLRADWDDPELDAYEQYRRQP